jgi:hypothetical protein
LDKLLEADELHRTLEENASDTHNEVAIECRAKKYTFLLKKQLFTPAAFEKSKCFSINHFNVCSLAK